jgi:hypothetical protein
MIGSEIHVHLLLFVLYSGARAFKHVEKGASHGVLFLQGNMQRMYTNRDERSNVNQDLPKPHVD